MSCTLYLKIPGDAQVLRELQVQWHPDKQYGDESEKQLAEEVSRLVNDAAVVAREQAAKVKAQAKRTAAYEELQRFGRGTDRSQVPPLRTAIEKARDAGVSNAEISKAEQILRRLTDQ